MLKERDSLADKNFQARLAGAKKDIFASEINKIDAEITNLTLGAEKVAKKQRSQEETASMIAKMSGQKIVMVKAKAKK